MNLVGGKAMGVADMSSLHKPSGGLSMNDPSSSAVLAMQQEMTIGGGGGGPSKPTPPSAYQTNSAAQPNDLGNSNKVGVG